VTKFCASCRTERPVTDFCRNKQSRDALTSYCKDCLRVKRAASRAAHPRPRVPDLRPCKVCEKSFSFRQSGRTGYCSDECFRNRKVRPTVVELRQCPGCGVAFEASTSGQGAREARKTYCSSTCFAATKSRKNALKTQTCRSCGNGFTRAERGAQEKFCSDDCKKAKRRADKLVAARKCTAKAIRATCDSCGLWFRRQPDSVVTTCQPCQRGIPTKHALASTYTNRGCRCRECTTAVTQERLQTKYKQVAAGNPLDVNHRARARRYGVEAEYINKLAVFERDNWTCGICNEAVDREAPWPAASSPSLDHIVPMAVGGGHVYENVQCAHLRCNVIKNDGRKAASVLPP
jgi:hypothetical protein